MKKPAVFCLVLLFSSFWCVGQSNNTGFIDSPSWVLAEGKETKKSPVESNRGGSQAVLQAVQTSQKAEASVPKVVRPRKEGFFHVGVYVVPVVNWLSMTKGTFDRGGVNFSVVPTVMFDMRLIRRIYMGVGVTLNTFGGKIASDCTFASADGNSFYAVDYTRSFNFSYLEIPVRVKIQTRNFAESRGSLFFSAGLNLGFGLSYKYKDSYSGIPINPDFGDQVGTFEKIGRMKGDSKLANLSAVGQIGFNYQILPRINLIIGVEYHCGVISPLKKSSSVTLPQWLASSWPKFNNQQVGLLLGVMF